MAEPTTTPGGSSEDVFTYSIAPKFKINERMAVYARVAKGFRPGGPNVIALDAPEGTPTSYGSDTTLNYELGVKGETEARTFAFDVAAFHIDWDDIQLLARVNGVGINTNAGGAESDGVEATLMFRPVDPLKLSLTGAYTDAKLTEDTDELLVGGREGDRLPYTPKTSYSVERGLRLAAGRRTERVLRCFIQSSLGRARRLRSGFCRCERSAALPARVRRARCAGRLGLRQSILGIVRSESHQR